MPLSVEHLSGTDFKRLLARGVRSFEIPACVFCCVRNSIQRFIRLELRSTVQLNCCVTHSWGLAGSICLILIILFVSAVSSLQKLATFLLITLSLSFHSGVAHYFRHAKMCRSFCGASFCGAPVRPNMLNMPISAAAPFKVIQGHRF